MGFIKSYMDKVERTYREHVYNLCTDTDYSDKDDVVALVTVLANDATTYHDMTMVMERKLMELMSAKDYKDWSREQAKRMFRDSVYRLEDGEFKDFCIKHFDTITGEQDV